MTGERAVRVVLVAVGLTTSSADSLLGGGSESLLELEVVDSVSDGLSEGGSLLDGLLSVSSSDSDPVDEVALLGLVTQSSRLVRSRRSRSSVDDSELTVLPAPEQYRRPESEMECRQRPWRG